MSQDPFATHLQRAQELFRSGEVLQAGQIWQAILKRQADHAEARAGLLKVKLWLEARKAKAAAPSPPPPPPPDPGLPSRPPKATVPYKPFPAPQPAPPIVEPEMEAEPEAPEPSLPESEAAAPFDEEEPDPVEKLLKEGCTLYDMGQVEDALQKWEQILERSPHHPLAKDYILQARRDLGRSQPMHLLAPSPRPAAPPQAAAPLDVETMLQRASQLYEMGSLEQCIASLDELLEREPGHTDALRFRELARRELEQATPAAPPPPAAPTPPAPQPLPVPVPASQTGAAPVPPRPSPPPPVSRPTGPAPAPERTSGFISRPGLDPKEGLEQKLQQGERLLRLGRFEEAGFAFQMALTLSPGEGRAVKGLEFATTGTRPVPPPATEHRLLRDETLPGLSPPPAAPPPPQPAPVQPPATLTAPASPERTGPEMPRSFQDLAQHPFLGSTGVLVGGLVLIVILGIGGYFLREQRKDARLRSAVVRARESAVAPVANRAQAPDLSETSAAIRQEAESVLAYDPVRAYHRARELLRRNPEDAVAAALLEKGRTALSSDPVAGVSMSECNRLLAAGDLEGADRALDALLRARPEDSDLMARAARLNATLAGLHASKGEWSEAKNCLLKGRALFPQDSGWRAKLILLEKIQGLPKTERGGWIPLLG